MSEQIFNVVVVEDNLVQRELVVRYVVSYPELKLSGIAADGKEAMEILAKNGVDLLVLDINLPYLSGMKILEKLENKPYVIFATSDDSYAARAFELGAVDYILKPVSEKRFKIAIERFLTFASNRRINSSKGLYNSISINESGQYFPIAFDKIIYISAAQKKSIIHTGERDYEAIGLLGEIEGKLPHDVFFRIHKKYIINTNYLSYVKYIDRICHAYLKDDDESCLPIGRTHLDELKSKMNL